MRDTLKLVIVLGLFCILSAGILAKVYDVTKGPIAEAKAEEVRRAIKAVLPPYNNKADAEFVDKIIGKDGKGNDIVRRVYIGKKDGNVVGRAFLVVAPDGYGGPIEIMMGVNPKGVITGIEIISLSETPGLGAKISSVKTWPGRGSGPGGLIGKSLKNNLKVKRDGGEIDQITGATISPRAVVKAVKKGLEFYKREFREN
ncbi:MAG: RnfABCDGE type electron transport complex subunit G [Deltaproteobacteria bacterium]|nr:RnfABCDGE type electron transport complex subunit G [Deltaproteobacteria bacterium]